VAVRSEECGPDDRSRRDGTTQKKRDCDWYTAIVFLTQAHMTTYERRLKGPNQFLHGAEPNYGSLTKLYDRMVYFLPPFFISA
jgi:hypothetical protein